jgi:hypothetical protein
MRTHVYRSGRSAATSAAMGYLIISGVAIP